MKNLDVDWAELLEALPVYLKLNKFAREALIIHGPYSSPVRPEIFGALAHDLQQAGIFGPSPGGRSIVLMPRFKGLVKALRVMHRSTIDSAPDTASFDRYIADVFSSQEWGSFYAGSFHWGGRQGLYSTVASVDWIDGFLKSNPREWEGKRRPYSEPEYFGAQRESEALKKLLKDLKASPQPVEFTELRTLCPDPGLLASCLRAGIRYALVFPMLRRETFMPLLGLWPGITTRLHRPAAKAPQTVTPVQTFSAPLHMDDMAAALTACIGEPLRLMANRSGVLYQKSREQVDSRLSHLPDWLASAVKVRNEHRIEQAIWRMMDMKLLKTAGEPGKEYRLEATDKGKSWLAMPAKERVKEVLNRVRAGRGNRGNFFLGFDGSDEFDDEDQFDALEDFDDDEGDDDEAIQGPAYLDEMLQDIWLAGGRFDLGKDLSAALARIPTVSHVAVSDFLSYESRVNNPLVERQGRFFRYAQYDGNAIDDAVEENWAEVLGQVIMARLMPLGAIEMGVLQDGKLTLALSGIGQYLLGQAADFTLHAPEASSTIIVQPNFEIVFMAAAPLAEVELGRFAERQGKHVGAVLKITKKSAWAAAAAGMSAGQVLEALSMYSSVPVPSNVDREIRGWMAQCRRATLRAAVLIHCPDAETASRVFALEKTKLLRMTDTVLELNDPSYRPKLAKKLREIGVFV